MNLTTYLFTPQCIAALCVLLLTFFAVARYPFLRPYFEAMREYYHGEVPYDDWYRIIFDTHSSMFVREKFLRLYIYHGYTTLEDLSRVCENLSQDDFYPQEDTLKAISHARNQLTKNQQFLRLT